MISQAFSSYDLEQLSQIASDDTRRRKHFNLHSDFEEPVQYFVNRILSDSYIRPHRHDLKSGLEILVALSGVSVVLIFNDSGNVEKSIILEPLGTSPSKDRNVVVTLAPMTWHTVIALDENVTLLEIKKGPFHPLEAKQFAEWAPAEGSEVALDYLRDLVDEFKNLHLGL